MGACVLRAGVFFPSSSLLLAPQPPFATPQSKSPSCTLSKCQHPHVAFLSLPLFSLSFLLLTLISHRLNQPLSPRLCTSSLALFVFRLPLFLPTARRSSNLASLLIFQPVSQSERQSPQSCKVTLSQTVVPAETYSKRLCFFWFFSCPRG